MKREAFVAQFLPFLRPVAGMIYDEIQNVRPLSGRNTSVSDARGGGRVVDAKAGSTGAVSEVSPFDVSISDGQAAFVPGLACDLVPENILESVAVPTASTAYAFVRINTDGKSPQNCALMAGTTAPMAPTPTKNALPLRVDVLLHLIVYTAPTGEAAAGTYATYRVFYPTTNIKLTPVLAFQTSVTSPMPGASPYDNWYTWQIEGT